VDGVAILEEVLDPIILVAQMIIIGHPAAVVVGNILKMMALIYLPISSIA
jgi:hypothetical protein